jgi:Putative porin
MQRRAAVVMLAGGVWFASTLGAGAAMTTEQRLRALEDLVRQQQEEIRSLRGELRQQKAIGTATQQQAERAEEQGKATEKTAKAALPEWVNKFTPFGDIRIRHEGFYDLPTPKGGGSVIHARNRERFRWRLGVKYAYSDELSATIRLASGNPDDPISTNETFDGSFSRKHVNLDWAYLTVAPGKTFGIRPGLVTLNAGKFPNPMFRVGEDVFDDDLSPEGFNETFQLLEQPIGGLDQVKIHAQQWTFKEVANAQDGWMFGGQINPTGHVGDVQLEGGLAQYWWLNPDFIAQAGNTNSVIKGANAMNAIELAPDGRTITGFDGAFNQTNATFAATVPNAAGAMPLKLFADYVYNWESPDERAHGALGGVRLGNPKEQGDWAASLLYEYLERNAVIGAFTWSDFGPGGGTNQQGPVIALDYQLYKPLTLTARTYFTKFVDAPATINNRMAVRLQLDAQLRF